MNATDASAGLVSHTVSRLWLVWLECAKKNRSQSPPPDTKFHENEIDAHLQFFLSKTDKNNGHFTWRTRYVLMRILTTTSYIVHKMFRTEATKAVKNTDTLHVQHTSPVSVNAFFKKITKQNRAVSASTVTLYVYFLTCYKNTNASVYRKRTVTISLLQNCHTHITWPSCEHEKERMT
jgi:hypothetical protein